MKEVLDDPKSEYLLSTFEISANLSGGVRLF